MNGADEIILLRTLGRAGSVFLHNLFDGHPRLLMFPLPFRFYALWESFHASVRKPQREQLLSFFLAQTELRSVFRGEGSWAHEQFLNAEDIAKSQVDPEGFRRNLIGALPEDPVYPTRKQFLLALHRAFAATTGLHDSDTRRIFLHEHNGYGMKLPAEDFASVKNIVMVRDPRNTYASSLKWAQVNHPYALELNLDREVAFTFDNQINIFHFADRHPGACHFLRTEDLNREPEKFLRPLCDWLGIEFVPTLLQPTSGGYPVKGFSVFNSRQLGFDRAALESRRWEQLCSRSETTLIEGVFAPILNRFDYPVDTPSPAKFLGALLTPDRRVFFSRYATWGAWLFSLFTLAYLRAQLRFLRFYWKLVSGTSELRIGFLNRWAPLIKWKLRARPR